MKSESSISTAKNGVLRYRPKLQIWHFVVLLAIIVFCVFPFYWMVVTSFKNQQDILSPVPKFFFSPTLENYQRAVAKFDVALSLENSLIVALSTTALSLLLGTPAAYAIARFEFKGKKDLWFWFITNRMLSPIVLALPFFILARNLKLLDTQLVLILIYLTFNVPIVIWICADQFRNIPKELDEAATLEGYNSFAIFWQYRSAAGCARYCGLRDLQLYLLLERTALRVGSHSKIRSNCPGRGNELHERL